MKKLLIAILFLCVPAPCFAQDLNIGTFDNKTYLLQTESVRFCSTPSCIYIDGQEQSYVGAVFTVMPQTRQQGGGDALSYSKVIGYETKSVLFTRDGSRFVLVQTTQFDINGNPIGTKDETVGKITLNSNVFTATTNSKGTVTSVERDGVDVERRKIAWSNVFPDTPGEQITQSVLGYAYNNYSEVMTNSRANNSMTAR